MHKDVHQVLDPENISPTDPSPACCWGAAIVYRGGFSLMAYSSFLRTETKDQTEDSRSLRRKRGADKQKERKGRIKI